MQQHALAWRGAAQQPQRGVTNSSSSEVSKRERHVTAPFLLFQAKPQRQAHKTQTGSALTG